jgi:Flp pilus assembly protein TadG
MTVVIPPPKSGGGGGGASLYNLPWTDVDLTDGSWTLQDSGLKLDTVTNVGSGFMRVRWGAAANGSDYSWTAGADHVAPRWYKDLVIDGTTVTTGDLAVIAFRMEIDGTVDNFDQAIVAAHAPWPNLDPANSMSAAGGFAGKYVGSNNLYGAWTISTATQVNNKSYAVIVAHRGGGGVGAVCGQGYDALNVASGNVSRNANLYGSTSLPLRLMIGVGNLNTTASTVSAGDEQKFSIKYKALTVKI